MAEKTWFVVERHPNIKGEVPALYYEHLPPRLTGKNAKRDGLIYVVRVDTLPNASRWLTLNLAQLYDVYCIARDRSELPPLYQEPSLTASEPAKAKLGHRERQTQYPRYDGEPMPAMVPGWQPRKGPPIMPLED